MTFKNGSPRQNTENLVHKWKPAPKNCNAPPQYSEVFTTPLDALEDSATQHYAADALEAPAYNRLLHASWVHAFMLSYISFSCQDELLSVCMLYV